MFQRGLSEGLKRGFVKLMQHQGEVPEGNSPPPLRSISMKTVQQASQVFILADIQGGIAQFVCNGRPVTIDGTRLKMLLLKEM